MMNEKTPPSSVENPQESNRTQGTTLSVATDTIDTLEKTLETTTGPRTPEQCELERKSNGKIVLRVNEKGIGVIDLYTEWGELICKGLQRLTSTRNINDPKQGVVNGSYPDKNGNTGNPNYTYFTGDQAMEEANLQGLKLFSKEKSSYQYQFRNTLGTTSKEKADALSILFGSIFSGCRDLHNKKWNDVGSISYLGLSEPLDNGMVYEVVWDRDVAIHHWSLQYRPQPFLACESYY